MVSLKCLSVAFAVTIVVSLLINFAIIPYFKGGKISLIKVYGFYVLAQPSIDGDWNDTRIFEKHDNFLVIGFTDKFDLLDQLLKSPLKSSLIYTVCRAPHPVIPSQQEADEICDTFDDFAELGQFMLRLLDTDGELTTHIFIRQRNSKEDKSLSILFAQLHQVSPSSNGDDKYFYCYGLPKKLVAESNLWQVNCPPCICPAVIAGKMLVKNDLGVKFNEVMASLSGGGILPVDVQKNSKKSNSLLKNSRFVACLPLQDGGGISSPKDVFIDGETPQFASAHAWAVREYFLQQNMRLGLDSGTLLGWYRNCSNILSDVDMDFFTPSWGVNKNYYKWLLDTVHRGQPIEVSMETDRWSGSQVDMKSTRIFGDLESSVEVRFEVTYDSKKVGIDVFVLHLDDKETGFPHTDAFITWKRKIIFYALPVNLTLCSTIFLRDIYLVPCEPGPLLESHYGPGWMTPAPRQDSFWMKQSNIKKKIKFTPLEWIRRRMYTGFE